MEDKRTSYEKINLDMFGKKISLFFNGNETDGTTFGKVMTFTYVGLYIILFLIFTCMVILKNNGSYYDSEINPEELTEVKLNNDLLYFGFSLQNAQTYDSYLDETIYYPKAYYKQAKRENNIWKWEIEEIEIEKCKIEKFGKKYQSLFATKPLENLYCFKNLSHILKGHYIYDEYSLYAVSIFPCVNTTENNNSCKSTEEIENKMENSYFTIELENIGLSPKNHSYPAQPIIENLYTSIGSGLLREFHVLLELVQIQTDDNLIFEDFKTENYLRYYKNIPMLSIRKNNIQNGESVCNFELKLSDKIKIQKRSYTKIYTSLSNTGGVMIFIRGLIFLVSFLPVQTLHELNVINKLFKIDKSKKELALNNLKKFKVMALKHSATSSFGNKKNNKIKRDKIILSSFFGKDKDKGMIDIVRKGKQQRTYISKINHKIRSSNIKTNYNQKKNQNNINYFYIREGDSVSNSNLVNKKNDNYKNDDSRTKINAEISNNIINRINHIDISELVDNKDDNSKHKNIKNENFKIGNVSSFAVQKEQIENNNNFDFKNYLKSESFIRSPQIIKKNNSDKAINKFKTRYPLIDALSSSNNKEKKLKLSYFETYFVRICKGKMKSKNILLFEEITDCYRKYLDVIKIFRNQIVFDRLIENNMYIEQAQKLRILNNQSKKKPLTTSPQIIEKKIEQKLLIRNNFN